MSKTSKFFLIAEMIVIGSLTAFGLIYTSSVFASYFTGQLMPGRAEAANLYEVVLVSVITLAVASGWRIFLWVWSEGPLNGTTISVMWWMFSFVGAGIALVAFVVWQSGHFSKEELPAAYIPYLAMGVYFLVPLGHLICEVTWQRGANGSPCK